MRRLLVPYLFSLLALALLGPVAAEEGDPAQVCHVEKAELREFQHPVDEGARREMRSLHGAVGLERQAVRWSRVSVGDRSTAFHTHDRTDEWVYVLAGSARVRVGDDEFEVSAGELGLVDGVTTNPSLVAKSCTLGGSSRVDHERSGAPRALGFGRGTNPATGLVPLRGGLRP